MVNFYEQKLFEFIDNTNLIPVEFDRTLGFLVVKECSGEFSLYRYSFDYSEFVYIRVFSCKEEALKAFEALTVIYPSDGCNIKTVTPKPTGEKGKK